MASALTRRRIRDYAAIFVVLGVAGIALAIGLGRYPLVAGGQPFSPDFLAHWTGGRMVLDGRLSELFDPMMQARLQHHLVGSDGLSWFVSPPLTAWLYLPFSAMPYGLAAAAWFVLDVGLLALALTWTRPLLVGPMADHRRLFVLAFCASPAVFEVLGSGQDSLLVLVIWVGALRLLMAGRDASAGALLALGLFKPQLFVLVPFVLLAKRRHRALASFTAMALTRVGAVLALGGTGIYVDWYQALSSPLYAHQVQEGQSWKMQSLPALFESLVGLDLASPLLLVAGLVVAGLIPLLWRVRQDSTGIEHTWAMLTLVTVVTSPHLLLYDLVLLLPCLAWLMSNVEWAALRGPLVALFALQWLVPVLHATAGLVGPFGRVVEAPWAALPLAVLTVRTLRWRPATQPPAGGSDAASGEAASVDVAHHAPRTATTSNPTTRRLRTSSSGTDT